MASNAENVSIWWRHNVQSTSRDYYFEDDFNSKIGNKCASTDKLSFFHMNIKSLPKHHNELEIYLDSLHVKFSFIALSETCWMNLNMSYMT